MKGLPLLSFSFLLLPLAACAPPRSSHIVVGSKNFTEQVLLSELIAQETEAMGGGPVERRFWLAGSYLCQQALISGRIDSYVEYTGTALTAILKQPLNRDPQQVDATVKRLYQQRYQITAEPSLGFEDTFALVVRGEDAARYGLKTIDDLRRVASQWKLGVGYEFAERPDGLPGLRAAYDLHFDGSPRTMELGLLYRALGSHQVDVVAGNSTDGAIKALGYVALLDDRHYFPPYEAVPLVRDAALTRWPVLRAVFQRLAGQVSDDDMRSMNLAVDRDHKDEAEVVREFRRRKGL